MDSDSEEMEISESEDDQIQTISVHGMGDNTPASTAITGLWKFLSTSTPSLNFWLEDVRSGLNCAKTRDAFIKQLVLKTLSILQDMDPVVTTVPEDVYKQILDIMSTFHCERGRPFLDLPLIILQWNRSTKELHLGKFKQPEFYRGTRTLTVPEILKLKHASSANTLMKMLKTNCIHLMGMRNTPWDKKADLTTHGLLYCGVDTKPSCDSAKEARYGAAVVRFQLPVEGRKFYKLGSRYFEKEISQQLFSTLREGGEWRAIAELNGNEEIRSVKTLKPVDMTTFQWKVGIGVSQSPDYRWVHPEVVIEEGVKLHYDKVEIHFVDNHDCINLGPRRPLCPECDWKTRMKDFQPKNWDLPIPVKVLDNDNSNSATICMDFLAMQMVEDEDLWKLVQKLQKKYKLFKYYVKSKEKNQFLPYIKERMETLRPYYDAPRNRKTTKYGK